MLYNKHIPPVPSGTRCEAVNNRLCFFLSKLKLPVGVLNPIPAHPSYDLRKAASFVKPIRKGVLSASQFPNRLKDAAGEFFKPPAW